MNTFVTALMITQINQEHKEEFMNEGKRNYCYEYQGEMFTFNGLCERLGIKQARLRYKMVNKGLSLQDAIEECMREPRTWGNQRVDIKKEREGRSENVKRS